MAHDRILFDAATTSLNRCMSLVEASAGTGKTYAVAMLVLRLIVEYSLGIEEILLVTFTRAATEELAARIRLRLAEARDLLLDSQNNENNHDLTLLRWAENLGDRKHALSLIQSALQDIDKAPIFTIHGFCQRMLQEQAVESGQLFEARLLTDVENIRIQAVEDYWRKNIYRLGRRSCSAVLTRFDTPEKLYHSIAHPADPFVVIEPETTPLLTEENDNFEVCFFALASWWRKNGEKLFSAIEMLVTEKKMKKDFANSFSGWWQTLGAFFEERSQQIPQNLERLSRDGFSTGIHGSKVRGGKKEELLAQLDLPEEEIHNFLDAAKKLVLCLRTNLAHYLIKETERELERSNTISFDDLITRMYRVVTSSQGKGLCRILRLRFRAALIDEFQDTDEKQWQIFRTIFTGQDHFLYLIGDPKQAIYRFRGADIHTYFHARDEALSQLTLEKNYRSHPALVEEINRLFRMRSDPFVFPPEILDFIPATPALSGNDSYLEKDGVELENFIYCQLDPSSEKTDGLWSSAKAGERIMHWIVKEVRRLLKSHINFHDKDTIRQLLPKDIAILVRTNTHGEQYQQCFARVGIAAVVANKKSLYATDECHDMLVVLQSIYAPGDMDKLKQAMAVSWFGLSGNELYGIWNDERLFDQWHARFQSYGEIWKNRGFLIMINCFLHQEKIYLSLGGTPLAERKIANIQHLCECIQQAESERMFAPDHVVQWLEKRRLSDTSEEELRLESDEDAVRIVTMHGAKGLEFQVVFCPYLWYRLSRTASEHNRISCHEEGKTVVDLGSEKFEQRRETVMFEEMAEELRLAYVATTRAKLRCYCFWCDVKGSHNGPVDSFFSALGYLLFPEKPVSHEKQSMQLKRRQRDGAVGYLAVAEHDSEAVTFAQLHAHEPHLSLKKLSRSSFHTDRQITSYSALAASSPHFFPNVYDEAPADRAQIIEFAMLPAGARFGNIVHDIFEALDFSELLQPARHRLLLEEKCRRYGVNVEIALLERLLYAAVSTPLQSTNHDVGAFFLSDIEARKCVKEMGFYFHLQKSETALVNQILREERTVAPLDEHNIEGYLTGYIDLIFEREGRYYIADYKTNNLGHSRADYREERLERAMASHNYGLQLWLYSLVLHRHLTNFLPGYDVDTHLGGVFYLFVRGMGEKGHGVFFHAPDKKTLLLLDSSLGGK